MGHLSDVNMSCSSHFFRATRFGLLSIAAGLVFIFHGIFPDYCIHTGSSLIHNLYDELDDTNNKNN
jgi:hypothetical protein